MWACGLTDESESTLFLKQEEKHSDEEEREETGIDTMDAF